MSIFRRLPATLPQVEPLVPVLRAGPFDDPHYLFEPKYDGFRGLLYVTGKRCCIRSRQGHVLHRFDELCLWVRDELPVEEAILDGEVITLDSEGRPNFRELVAGLGNLHYAAFDALWVDGRDLRNRPLSRRKKALERLIWATSTVLSPVLAIEERGRDLFEAARCLDLEGIVAKRRIDPYAPGTVWYKVTNRAYSQMEGRGEPFERR
jgi:bifunctional non-homologous end joining protein LigD